MEKVIYIETDLHAAFKEFCSENGMSMKEELERMIGRRMAVVQQLKPYRLSSRATKAHQMPPFWAKQEPRTKDDQQKQA
jgi:hypothetical protein